MGEERQVCGGVCSLLGLCTHFDVEGGAAAVFFFFFLMSDLIYLLLLEHLIFDWTQT